MAVGKSEAAPYLLLIEDNEDDAFFTLRELQKHDFPLRLERVVDGPEAIAYLEATGLMPVFILLDDHLPRLSGQEVLTLLHRNPRTEHIPVIALSGSKWEWAQVPGGEPGARPDARLRKPLYYLELSRELRRLGLLPDKYSRLGAAASVVEPRSTARDRRPAMPRQGAR